MRISSLSLFLIGLLACLVGSHYASAGQRQSTSSSENTQMIAIVRAHGGAVREILLKLTVEIVSDRESRRRGLSGRDRMAEDRGMLFILEEGRPGSFWMKGMKFPLDLLYFDKEKRLIMMRPGLEPCDDCLTYETPANTAYVLEVDAGIAENYGIKAGDSFVFSRAQTGDAE